MTTSRKSFKDFPPLYLLLMLGECGLAVWWALLFVAGGQLAVIDLPSLKPRIIFHWPFILFQFVLSAVAFVGVLKYASLKIEYRSLKERSEDTISSLLERLQAYEPDIDEEAE